MCIHKRFLNSKNICYLFSWFCAVTFVVCTQARVSAQMRLSNIRIGRALQPKKFAVVIGIQRSVRTHYWDALRFARRDAKRFTHALHRTARFDRILTLTKAPNTTRASIVQAIHTLRKWNTSAQDTIVVYISAHGTISTGRERFIVTSDTTQNIQKTGLSVRLLQRELLRLKSRKIGLILATCYTGSRLSKAVRVVGSKGRTRPVPFPRARAIQILSAASYAQSAFESVKLRSDVYTHFFIQCLSQLSKKTIVRIHACATQRTTPFVRATNGEIQVPKVYSVLGANRDFALFSTLNTGRKVGYLRFSWRRGKRWIYRVFRRHRKGKSSLQAQSGEVTALTPGQYTVVVLDPKGQVHRKQHVSVSAHQVARVHTDWSLGLQAGSHFSRKGGSVWMPGAVLGLQHRFWALRLGVWGAQKRYAWSQPGYHIFSSVSLDLGYRWEWEHWNLFAGASTSVGGLWKHVLHPSQTTSSTLVVALYGTLASTFWLGATGWGIWLQGDAGASWVPGPTMLFLPEAALHVGLSFRL